MTDAEEFIKAILLESLDATELDVWWLTKEALERGFMLKVPYDPSKHGDVDADDGDDIFVLSERLCPTPISTGGE